MGDVFGKPAIVTDTHCIRLVNRMGLVDGIKEPKKVEMAFVEAGSTGRGKRFLPSAGDAWKRDLYGQNPSILRTVLPFRYLHESRRRDVSA